MKYVLKLTNALAFSTLLLAGCQGSEEKEPAEPEKEVVEEVKQEIPSKETFIDLADQHFNGIADALSQAAFDFNLQGGDMTDAIYDAMKASFGNFATAAYIDGDLKLIAKDYCYAGCDMKYFPYHVAGALNVELEQLSDTEVKLTAQHPADMMSSSVAIADLISFKLDGGLWKIDDVGYEEITLQLTEQQAATITGDWGYSNPKLISQDEDGYMFETNEATVFVGKGTGYVEEQAAPTPAPSVNTSPGTLYEQYNAKFDAAATEVERLENEFTGYTTVEMNALAADVFDVWDTLLNDMYQALKKNLPADEFAQLQQEQRQWITERDEYAEYTATEQAEGGTAYNMIYIGAQSEYTSQRCADFLFDYMVGL